MKMNLENKDNKENFLTHPVEYFSKEKKVVKKELKALSEPIDAMTYKLHSAETTKDYEEILKEIAKSYGVGEGSLGNKIKKLKDKIRYFNKQITLRTRKDLVEQYLVIKSSTEDAYNILTELPADSDPKITEDLITELEEGLVLTKKMMSSEGVSMDDVESYSEMYSL